MLRNVSHGSAMVRRQTNRCVRVGLDILTSNRVLTSLPASSRLGQEARLSSRRGGRQVSELPWALLPFVLPRGGLAACVKRIARDLLVHGR
jgi:hypothetical protein